MQDLLASPRVPRVELHEIFRQDPGGDIARNAKLIRDGKFPSCMTRLTSTGEFLLSPLRDKYRPQGVYIYIYI